MRGHIQIPMFFVLAFCAVYVAFVWLAPQAASDPSASAEASLISQNRAYQQLRAEVDLFTTRKQ